jgi:hypothetical protein
MSEEFNESGQSRPMRRFVGVYSDFCQKRFRHRKTGKPLTHRAMQNVVKRLKRLGMPVLHVAGEDIIDEELGDDFLASLAQPFAQPQRRGPGRPRTVNAITPAEIRPEHQRRGRGRPRAGEGN